jgi:aminoglycoside phosphotransferase family enzyme/predicted kinase
VYLDVAAITCQDGAYRLGGAGAAVEYAVKMRRLPDACSMKYLLRAGRVGDTQINDLARALTAFYGRHADAPPLDRENEFDIIKKNCEENFVQTETYKDTLFDREVFGAVRSMTRAFLSLHKPLFFARMDANRFQDCHGDLRTGHVYFTDHGIQIIDCIEFNDRFRYQDVASDLGFLIMDLEFMGYPIAAATLLAACARLAGDPGMYPVIDFYKAYRAFVRLKVTCIRYYEPDVTEPLKKELLAKIRRYLHISNHYIERAARPRLWVVCGMPASGKTTIAEALGRLLMAQVISSDRLRKDTFGPASEKAEHLAFEADIYSKDATRKTYGKMLELAAAEIECGNSVIIDATFGESGCRRKAIRLSEKTGAAVLFIECAVPGDLIKQRLRNRENQKTVSDARLAHLDFFKKRFEPLTEIEDHAHIVINTENDTDTCVNRVLSENYKNTQPN